MGTAVFGAPEFKTRSGRTVRQGEDGTVTFHLGNGYLDPNTALDAEELFQAKRDRELGRWRWAENPDWIAVEGDRSPDGRTVVVVNERTLDRFWFNERVMTIPADASAAHKAGCAYFEAHPEVKPWHDAKRGEVWAVTETNGEALYRVSGWGRFEQVSGDDGLLSMPVSHVSITDARRVWPEDAS